MHCPFYLDTLQWSRQGTSDVGGAPISHVVLGPPATGPVLKATETKKPRPGRPHCFRLEVWETKDGWSQPAKDSQVRNRRAQHQRSTTTLLNLICVLVRQGNWKFVLDAGSDTEKQRWLTLVNGYGTDEQNTAESMEPEPEPEDGTPFVEPEPEPQPQAE